MCLTGLATMVSGCATYPGYWTDRKNDAADVFTAVVGVGAGAKARVGPFAPAVGLNIDYAGLAGGEFFRGFTPCHGADSAFLIPFATYDRGNDTPFAVARRKDYQGAYFIYIAQLRGEVEPKYNASYFTQIEVTAGLGGMVKIGFNPGELLDLLLGFVGSDIYGDDLEARKAREAKPPPSPGPEPKAAAENGRSNAHEEAPPPAADAQPK